MCHRFAPLSADEVDRVIDYLNAVRRLIHQGASAQGQLPAMPALRSLSLEAIDCYPGSTCTVIVDAQRGGVFDAGSSTAVAATDGRMGEPAAGSLGRLERSWGVEVPWRKGLVFNARIESALRGEGLWREAMETGRCLVPVRAFYETRNVPAPNEATSELPPKRHRPQYRFTGAADSALLLAGLVLQDHFVLITTEPDDVVGAVHNRMPLVLTAPEALTWLEGAPAAQALLADKAQVSLTMQEVSAPEKTKRGRADSDPGADQLSLF